MILKFDNSLRSIDIANEVFDCSRGGIMTNISKSTDIDQSKNNILDLLTEKQIAYIKKLGQTKGRNSVPIDLNLYRDLVKLQLVVDKGRRLALSKLGSEVFEKLS